MKISNKLVFVQWVLVLITLLATNKAESQYYRHTQYTQLEGLPSSAINQVIQDSRGYLWIGTENGLSRYNGYDFLNISKAEGLNNDFIKCIYEDSKSNLWIGSNEGLNKLDLKSGSNFKVLSIINDLIISSILEFQGKVVYSSNKGIHIDMEKDSVIFHELSRVRALKVIGNDLYIGCSEGLYKMQNIHSLPELVWRSETTSSSFVRCILNINQDLILGTMDGILHLNLDSLDIQPEKELSGYRISNLNIDSKNRIWISTERGIFSMESKNEIIPFKENEIKDEVNSNIEDYEGNNWIASKNGLYKYSEYPFSLLDPDKDKISGISSVLQLSSTNELLLGSSDGELYINSEGSPNEVLGAINDYTKSKPIHKIFETQDGEIWISSLLDGVFIWNGKELKNFTDPKGISKFFVFDIEQDQKSKIWIGGARGLMSVADGQFDYFGFSDRADVPFVSDIEIDDNDNIWLALNSGIGLLKGGSIYNFPKFSGKTCSSIKQLNSNEFYIGTKGYGLYHVKYIGDTLEVLAEYKQKNGLSNNYINSILIDRDDNIWVGTDFGINKIGSTGKIIKYRDEKNLLRSKCYQNAIYETENDILIGTYDALIQIPKREDNRMSIPPKTYITELKILNDDYDSSSIKAVNVNFGIPETIILPYNANFISLGFEAISFYSQSDLEYSFMLKGLESTFSNPSKSKKFTYTNLPPGNYEFLVRSRNLESNWTESPISVKISILPPYWQKWWFRILILSIILASIFWFINSRVSRIKKKEKEKSELNKKIAEFHLVALRAQMNPHFIFNALYSIQHFITINEKESAINYLAKFASLIRLILENSSKNEISLEGEEKMLDLYLDLEQLRFDNKFEYQIEIDENLSKDDTYIPYLLLQPFVENAIIHGIRQKETNGLIKIIINKVDEHFIKCIIEDNGIGRKASSLIEKPSPIKSQSMGIKVNKERLDVLNPGKLDDSSVKIVDLFDSNGLASGTRVEIKIPVNN